MPDLMREMMDFRDFVVAQSIDPVDGAKCFYDHLNNMPSPSPASVQGCNEEDGNGQEKNVAGGPR